MLNNKPIIFFFCTALILAVGFTSNLQGQNRSRISGSVRDAETGEPLIGVNIIIEETDLGRRHRYRRKLYHH